MNDKYRGYFKELPEFVCFGEGFTFNAVILFESFVGIIFTE